MQLGLDGDEDALLKRVRDEIRALRMKRSKG